MLFPLGFIVKSKNIGMSSEYLRLQAAYTPPPRCAAGERGFECRSQRNTEHCHIVNNPKTQQNAA